MKTREQAKKLLIECERENEALFKEIDAVALENTEKVLSAFRECRVAERHLKGSTGYGYGDIGRETLNAVFAKTLGAEDAIASPYFASGTHALKVSLYGLLRPGDTLLSVTGAPYDTLLNVITQPGIGSLVDYGVNYKQVDLTKEGTFDYDAIEKSLKSDPKIVFLTRSRGYSDRDAFSIEQLREAIILSNKDQAPSFSLTTATVNLLKRKNRRLPARISSLGRSQRISEAGLRRPAVMRQGEKTLSNKLLSA